MNKEVCKSAIRICNLHPYLKQHDALCTPSIVVSICECVYTPRCCLLEFVICLHYRLLEHVSFFLMLSL